MAYYLVRHTWNQKLNTHGHVTVVIPGGGPISDQRIVAADEREVTFQAYGGVLQLVAIVDNPSWRDVCHSSHRSALYATRTVAGNKLLPPTGFG